jgi:hypothetical protein
MMCMFHFVISFDTIRGRRTDTVDIDVVSVVCTLCVVRDIPDVILNHPFDVEHPAQCPRTALTELITNSIFKQLTFSILIIFLLLRVQKEKWSV